jgi:transcriptional regulator with XRE-family HTH domain
MAFLDVRTQPWHDPDSMGNFGERVRALRDARGFTQDEVSRRTDIDRTVISLIEHGKRLPRLPVFIRLVDCLGCEPEELLETLR